MNKEREQPPLGDMRDADVLDPRLGVPSLDVFLQLVVDDAALGRAIRRRVQEADQARDRPTVMIRP
mgnify:CR=1 FL=1